MTQLSEIELFTTGTVETVATPTFSLAGGTYTGSQNVTISTATTGSTIRYTTDGVDPTSGTGTLVNGTSGAVTVSSTATLKARAFKSGATDSGVASATYTISSGSGSGAPPGFTYITDENQSYTFGQMVDVAYGANGAFNYLYNRTGTIAFNNATFGDPISGVVKKGYYRVATVATPAFSVAGGTYTGSQTVTISTATTGATIRYTTDGVDPTSGTGTLINGTSGAVNISSSATLKTRAFKSGATDSGVASATYTINGNSALETFRTTLGLAADGSQDLLTPAADGVPNLLKYAFNLLGPGPGQAPTLATPNASVLTPDGTAGLPFGTLSPGPGSRLQLTFIRRRAATYPEITYTVQFSDTLAAESWAANPDATESAIWIDATFERVTVTDSVTTTPACRFVRVGVSAR